MERWSKDNSHIITNCSIMGNYHSVVARKAVSLAYPLEHEQCGIARDVYFGYHLVLALEPWPLSTQTSFGKQPCSIKHIFLRLKHKEVLFYS